MPTGISQEVNAQLGHNVSKGQVLFIVKTKEAQAIGNSINVLDTTFKFSGINKIKALRIRIYISIKSPDRRLCSRMANNWP